MCSLHFFGFRFDQLLPSLFSSEELTIARHNFLAGTLRAIVEGAAADKAPSEDPDMQVRAMRLIEYIKVAVGAANIFAVDTHKFGLRPDPNRGLIDCSVLATSKEALWSNLASLG